MAYKFPSDEWVKAAMAEINKSESYAEAAKTWEGDFYFIADMGGGKTQCLYMDLWHGKCRDAFLVTDESVKNPVFRMTGPVAGWKKVLAKQLDPIQGLMTGQLRLKGNMAMIMKNVKAAKELVDACARVDAEFPV